MKTSLEHTPPRRWPVETALGWLSVGLGLASLLVPRKVAAITGLDGQERLLQLVGARELASGTGLLTQASQGPWLWARVIGDAMDLAVLATAQSRSSQGRSRALGTAAVVAAITAADVAASMRKPKGPRTLAESADIYIDQTIIVNNTPRQCYDYWRELRNIPRFTRHLERVTAVDQRLSKWSLKIPGGTQIEWTAEILEDDPGKRLRWRSIEGSSVNHAGSVRFAEAPGGRGTFVTVSMHYRAPGGALGTALARVFGPDPLGEVREDLRRFKQVIETGEIPTTDGQPSGRRSLLGRMIPEGRRSRQNGAGRHPPAFRRSASLEERVP